MLLAMTFVYIEFRKQFLQSQISLWNIVQSFRHCHFWERLPVQVLYWDKFKQFKKREKTTPKNEHDL